MLFVSIQFLDKILQFLLVRAIKEINLLSCRNIELFGLVGGIAADLVLGASMINCLRILFKCAHTEPGIVPSISNKKMNQGGSYQVEYVREYERDFKSSNVEHFYTEDRFRLSQVTGPKIESYALSLCTTCNLLRPPRSFHCRTCGVCIEE